MSPGKAIQAFLDNEGVQVSLSELWVDPSCQRLSSLCYLERFGDVLMLQRKNKPFAGFWTVPGGKLEPGEDPRQAIGREMREETGLSLKAPQLQMIVSETARDPQYNWLLFIFRCVEFTGKLRECDEGTLQWVPREQLPMMRMHEIDIHLRSFIFDDCRRYVAHVVYDDSHGLTEMHVRSWPA